MDRTLHPDLPVQLAAVQACVEWAAGCRAQWQDTSEGGKRNANEVWCELRLRSIGKLGVDEERESDAGALVDWARIVTLTGLRELGIQATFRSRQQNFSDGNVAWAAAARAQLRIPCTYSRTQFLKPVQVSLLEPGEVLNMAQGYDWQDRAEDFAVLDMRFGAVISDEDSATFGSWIEHVLLTSNLKHTAAISLDGQLQLDDEELP